VPDELAVHLVSGTGGIQEQARWLNDPSANNDGVSPLEVFSAPHVEIDNPVGQPIYVER